MVSDFINSYDTYKTVDAPLISTGDRSNVQDEVAALFIKQK